MKITSLDVFPTRLPYREEFKISRGSVGGPGAGAPHLYVRVRAEGGREGWGEARPSHRWSYETEESVLSTLRGYLFPALVGRDAWDLRGLHAAMEAEIAPGLSTGAPVARSAVDIAVHDLLARAAGVPLVSFLGGAAEQPLPLTYILAVNTPAEAEERAAARWRDGYRGFKVKIGGNPRHDLELLRAVRGAAPEAYLWADANQAYDLPGALALCRGLEGLGVDCLEQPLPANDWLGMSRLARASAIPLAADESVFSPVDLLQLIRLEACHLLVVKVCKLGGLGPARRAIALARDAGLGVLGSGLTESRLGLTATAHLLLAGGGCHYADLNGPQFLAADPVAGDLELRPGSVTVPARPGIGLAPDPDLLERYAAPA
jgi:L-alanine-DL-glutamate epimerase-like enolase superfamily enzyme